MLDRGTIDALFPAGLPDPGFWEQRDPPRDLPQGAQVTRFCPSPTGFVHIGGAYPATIAAPVPRQSGERSPRRTRAPRHAHAARGERVRFTDAIRGELEHDANRNDAVILKSSDQQPQLPTYHFAHAVDDHLMRVSLAIRGDEWISSVPLHLQLFTALGFGQVQYAHIAPLMKQDGGSRRKLSKRTDPEASVTFYITAGYPPEAVQYYLRGLANGRLAEMPLPEALAAPIRLAECGVAGPLVDLVKLDDISADFIATLPGEQILRRLTAWAAAHDPELAQILTGNQHLALRALATQRDDTGTPRKD